MPPLAACLALAAAAWLLLTAARSALLAARCTVPAVPGLPLLGSAVALGRGGAAFISQCRQRFGPAFLVRLPFRQSLVFVFDPSAIGLFFKAPEDVVSFKPAVRKFTERVMGLPACEFFEAHEPLLSTLRQLLAPDQLGALGQRLLELAQPQLHEWLRAGEVELWGCCQRLVFASAGGVLFGEAFFTRHGMEAVLDEFIAFESHFELAASPVPHLLLPRFRSSRRRLLSMFRRSLAEGDFGGTVVEQLLQGCGLPQRSWPNLLLAVLWASQANSMPACYWSLAFLLLPEQAATREELRLELEGEMRKQQQQGEHQQQQQQGEQQREQQQQRPLLRGEPPPLGAAAAAAMVALALDRRSCASRCVAEAVRLRPHSVAVRYVAAAGGVDVAAGRVPRGTVLAVCPIESHHDPGLVAGRDPWVFDPGRAPVQGLPPGTAVPSLAGLGFGGGFWRCPGRFFAEMELGLFVLLVLHRLRLQPLWGPIPPSSAMDAAAAAAAAQRRALPRWLEDAAVFGLGALGGAGSQAWAWRASGDPGRLLPPAELRRLVGFKVPTGELRVRVGAAAPAPGRAAAATAGGPPQRRP